MKFPRMLIDGVVLMALLTALCLLPASPARGQAVSCRRPLTRFLIRTIFQLE